MTAQGSILLVEDEVNFGSVLSHFLGMNGFDVLWVKNGAEAWSIIKSERSFDCCVLDVMMPEMDGFALGKEIKATRPSLPFVYLTAKSLKEDVIRGFELGANDYITKPFDSEILVYKIKALLQFQPKQELQGTQFRIGQFEYDADLRMLRATGFEKRLSPKENRLLLVLARNMGGVVSREEIVRQIWEEDNYFTRRSMDVYMAKLRKYLHADPEVTIISLHAGGYQLKAVSKEG